MTAMFHDNFVFNQDLSGWCVKNITSEPLNFDDGATSWVGDGTNDYRPVWGTCPA
jgi:hypothetical protein